VTWLIETSILVDLLRGWLPARHWIDGLSSDDRYISVVTAAELLAGCRNRDEQRTVEREIALYPILWLDETSSQTALDWYRQFRLSHGLGFLDSLIGATAYHHDLTLATMNEKHFTPLPGLRVERPY